MGRPWMSHIPPPPDPGLQAFTAGPPGRRKAAGPAHGTETCNVTVIIRYSSTRSTSASTGTAHLAIVHVLATAPHP
jgi:hypothetical protein